jgi:hypothetical protein
VTTNKKTGIATGFRFYSLSIRKKSLFNFLRYYLGSKKFRIHASNGSN